MTIVRCCKNCRYCMPEDNVFNCFYGNLADVFVNGPRKVEPTENCKGFAVSGMALMQALKEKVR